MQAVNAAVSTLLQVGVVAAVCLLTWWVDGRRKAGFRAWVGLTAAPLAVVLVGAACGAAGAAAVLAVPDAREAAGAPGTVVAEIARHGLNADRVAALLIAAVLKTALSEELLFRGLIGKRAIARFGFAVGNTVQAGMFGLVHLALLSVARAPIPAVAALTAFTGAMGWFTGWLNERRGRGSILPGWAAHAAANGCAYLTLALIA